jgi:hypothetical protein
VEFILLGEHLREGQRDKSTLKDRGGQGGKLACRSELTVYPVMRVWDVLPSISSRVSIGKKVSMKQSFSAPGLYHRPIASRALEKKRKQAEQKYFEEFH